MTGNLGLGRLSTNRSNDSAAFEVGQASQELRFQPHSEVSAALQQNFEQVMLSLALPAKQDLFRKQLTKFDLIRIFNDNLTKSGYSAYDIADVVAAYVADSWQLMNDAPDPPPALVSALDRQMSETLTTGHALLKLSNNQKPQIAEFLAYEDVLNALAARAPEVQNDPSRRAKAQEHLGVQFRQLIGLDLRRVDLTPASLIVRP